MVKPGMYVTESGYHAPMVLQVLRILDASTAECRLVGELQNGRLRPIYTPQSPTHRKLANLQEWK